MLTQTSYVRCKLKTVRVPNLILTTQDRPKKKIGCKKECHGCMIKEVKDFVWF